MPKIRIKKVWKGKNEDKCSISEKSFATAHGTNEGHSDSTSPGDANLAIPKNQSPDDRQKDRLIRWPLSATRTAAGKRSSVEIEFKKTKENKHVPGTGDSTTRKRETAEKSDWRRRRRDRGSSHRSFPCIHFLGSSRIYTRETRVSLGRGEMPRLVY